MAKAESTRRFQGKSSRQCAWCSRPLHSEFFTVTFPDKEQARFHIECLYPYRKVVGSWTSR